MDTNKLLEALDDETNASLFNFTTRKIQEMNMQILNELNLSKSLTMDIYKKIKDYKYVDEMVDLKRGTFVRWIPIEDPNNIYLTKGALFCEMKIKDDGVYCICKSFGFPVRYFNISLDKNLIFQKLTQSELVLLTALDHLSKG